MFAVNVEIICIRPTGNGFHLCLHFPDRIEIDGDWSNAAFWLTAGAIQSSETVGVSGLHSNSTQGDREIVPILERAGAVIGNENGSINVSCGTIRLIIGTRSSLSLPFQNLGLIVVDEEHDQSYKQSDNGCYNGRDVAIMLAKLYDIPVILASATPSLETLINVDKGKYQKVFLPSRYGKAVLPDVKIIDLKI